MPGATWISWRLSRDQVELEEHEGLAEGLHDSVPFHVTGHLAAGRWQPRLQEPCAAWLRGTLDQQRLTLTFESDGQSKEEPLPETCALLTGGAGDCEAASLQFAVLWIVRPQDIHFAPAGRFIFGKPLGKGQSSQVMEVTDTTTGRTDLAAKVSEGGKSHQELLQEAMVLKALNSSCRGFPEFIGLFADAERPDTRFMVLQRFRCSVEDLRRENPSMGGLGVVQTVGMQVLSQLQAMHQLNLAHGDLKPKNIAVASVNPLKISLIDFGCCRPFRVSGCWVRPRSKAAVGTTRFCAIPAHEGERSPRCDLESLAYVLIHLASGQLPWQGLGFLSKSTREHSLQMLGKKQDFALVESHIRQNIPEALANALTGMAWIPRNLAMDEEPPYMELRNLLQSAKPTETT